MYSAIKNVPVLDLYQFTLNLGEESYIDHVHYNEKVRALQAAFIAGSLVTLTKSISNKATMLIK